MAVIFVKGLRKIQNLNICTACSLNRSVPEKEVSEEDAPHRKKSFRNAETTFRFSHSYNIIHLFVQFSPAVKITEHLAK